MTFPSYDGKVTPGVFGDGVGFTFPRPAASDISFGAPVCRVTGATTCAQVSSTADGTRALGISVERHFFEKSDESPGYKAGAAVSILRNGRVYLAVGGAVAQGAVLRWDTTLKMWVTTAASATVIEMTGFVVRVESETTAAGVTACTVTQS